MNADTFFQWASSESTRLLSKREGIHNLHGANGAIQIVCRRYANGKFNGREAAAKEYVEALLAKMRIAVLTGVYPKRDSEAGQRLKHASDILYGDEK